MIVFSITFHRLSKREKNEMSKTVKFGDMQSDASGLYSILTYSWPAEQTPSLNDPMLYLEVGGRLEDLLKVYLDNPETT